MANETTTTTANDISYSAAIEPTFHRYAIDKHVNDPFLKPYDVRGRGSAAIDVPKLTSVVGTPDDAGVGVDTEFDATQATDLANTARGTDKATLTATEYGVLFEITDNVLEDQVPGMNIMAELLQDAATILMAAWEFDVCASFTNFSGSVGTSGVDLTLANMSSALNTIRRAGATAVDNPVFVLDSQAAVDYEADILSTNAAQAVFGGTADSFLAVQRDAVNGLTAGMIGMFRGCKVLATGLCSTANAGADVLSSAYVPFTPGNSRDCALGKVIARDFRLETDRNIEGRATLFAASMRMGVGELLDAAGTKIVTDF